MNILGINAYHGDSSACIFINNKLVVAAEEERFKRIKHFAGFPIEAINFCLEYSNLKISDIDQISINRNPSARLIPKIFFSFKKLLNPKFLKQRIDNINKISNIKLELEKYFKVKINSKINYIDHHEAHVASAIFCSGYETCNFVSIDGFGDFASTSVGHFDGKKINKSFEILFPHSLGLFYTAITQFLGFNNYGDEYKVMGLAPYGKPNYTEQIKKILIKRNGKYELNLDYFVHHTSGINMTWYESEPKFDKVYSNKLIDLLGEDRKKDQPLNQKYKDVANSAQKVFEEIVIEIANDIYKKNISKNLCISGGCGMNSVANGKIKKTQNMKKFIFPLRQEIQVVQ